MIVANGSTNVTTYFCLRDSTTHAPKTSVTITDIDVYYVEQGAAISAKADLTAHSAANDAHADNYGFEIGQGLYRIDWPDAAFDGGVGKHVILIVVCSGVDTTFLDVELSPAVNTVAVGGTTQTGRDLGASVLLSSGTGTGQISLSSGAVTVGTNNDKTGYTASTVSDKTGYALTAAYDAAKTAATQTSVDTIDGIVDAILLDTAEIGTAGAGLTALASASGLSTLTGYVDTEVAAILAAVDTEVAEIKTKTDYLPSATAGSAGGVFIAGSNAATSVTTALTCNIVGDITGNLSGSVGSVTAEVSANVTKISGDGTAADNLESYCDGTTAQPVNVTKINSVTVDGAGTSGDPWGPA